MATYKTNICHIDRRNAIQCIATIPPIQWITILAHVQIITMHMRRRRLHKLESLPLPWECEVLPLVHHCFALLELLPPSQEHKFGHITMSQSLFWHWHLIQREHKKLLIVTALVTSLVSLPIMYKCYHACANSVLNIHPRYGFPELTLLNMFSMPLYT